MRKQKTKTQVQEITIRKQKITVRMEETKTNQPMLKKKRPGKILQDVWIMFEYSGLLPEKHHYCRYKVNS